MVSKKRSYDLILGIFVAVGLALVFAAVFLIGRERRLFDTSIAIEAHFPNVAGLARGADVMLAGVVVGHVSEIKFPKLRADVPGLSRDVTVVMEISHSAIKWVREDSIARIDSKGLLGDKIINIGIGSPELPQAQKGSMLQSTPPVDFNKALQQAQEILENVTETVSDAKDIFKGFVAQEGDVALAGSAKSIQRILHELEKGNGPLHELIYDKKAGTDTKATLASLSTVLKRLEGVADTMEKLGHQAKDGEGLINALFYDKKGGDAVKSANNSFVELASILKEIREGQGVLHDLIFQQDEGQFIRSLNVAAKDVESVVADVKNGRGSLGLLLKDPSIYNELYGLLGDLRRNKLLKAVIRYNISQNDVPKAEIGPK